MPGAAPAPSGRNAAKLTLAERRTKTAELAQRGWSYQRIVDEGNLGHRNKTSVHADVKHVLEEAGKKLDVAAAGLLAARLDDIRRVIETAHEVMTKDHLAHSNGRLVTRWTETGEELPVHDDAPRLAAAALLLKASESVRKLLGQDAPAKTSAEINQNTTVEYTIKATPEELDQL